MCDLCTGSYVLIQMLQRLIEEKMEEWHQIDLVIGFCRVGNAGSKKDGVSIEQILSHLDHMRQVCKNISCK